PFSRLTVSRTSILRDIEEFQPILRE
ncbi:MAG: hypothetical protein RIS79_1478, partial [Verrucomicrobiota bacterium]